MKCHISILTILMIMLMLLSSCTRPFEELSADELIDLGEKYLLDMNYEQAIVYFDRVIEIEPMVHRGYTGLAEAYVGIGEPFKAIDTLDRGVEQLPNSPEITTMFDELVSEQFELGEQLLTEQNYSGAVEQFTALIAVSPLGARGYTGCAEAYIGLEDIYKAIEILKKGLEKIPNEQSISEMLDNLLYEQQREDLALEATPILTELATMCSAGNYNSVFEKMQTDEFVAVTELSKFLNRPYITETEYGKIGVYEVNSEEYGNYMIYYGDYIDDARDGSGIWLGYFDGNNYFADCEWKSDSPNGYAKIREWNSGLNESVVYRVIDGNVQNGLWNGAVNWAFEEADETSQFPVDFDNGKWVIVRVMEPTEDTPNGVYIVSEKEGLKGSMSTDSPDELEGIIGFVE